MLSRGVGVGAGLLAALVLAACQGEKDEGTEAAGSPVCGYLYEWASAWRFPLQLEPHAAYSYVAPKITKKPVGFLIEGPFPYAAWTSWTIYTDKAKPYSVAEDSSIKPNAGSVNPFVQGTPVLSDKRDFTLLLLPHGVNGGELDPSLAKIPKSNRLESPDKGKAYVIANRVYKAFPGYNQGGAGGSTDTKFPQVKAVNYETGKDMACSSLNVLPRPKAPSDMPSAPSRSPSQGLVDLDDQASLQIGPQGSERRDGSTKSGLKGAQYAPELEPDRIEMTRPPLLPGADVSSIPPPDNCAGYLGAATSTTKIGLIRMPHVATWFDTSNLKPSTPFKQEEADYVSFTQYGNGLGIYDPGSPNSGSLGDEELEVDSSGGSTIVVWPRTLSGGEQKRIFDYAKREGWALLRGGATGPVTTANLLIRLKGAAPGYSGAYSPGPSRKGVPCYFDDHPKPARWSQVTGEKYVATAANIGAGAPQGVNCTADELLNGACLESLKAYIAESGGSYTAR